MRPGAEEALAARAEDDAHRRARSSVARRSRELSAPFLCSCRSLSGLRLLLFVYAAQRSRHCRPAFRLLGRAANSTSLALIELQFLFEGSCLVSSLSVSPSLPHCPAATFFFKRRVARVWSIAGVFVVARTAQERNKRIWVCSTRERKKEEERFLLNNAASYYLMMFGGEPLWALLDISLVAFCAISTIRYQIPILFISLCKDEQERHGLTHQTVSISILTAAKYEFTYFQCQTSHPTHV